MVVRGVAVGGAGAVMAGRSRRDGSCLPSLVPARHRVKLHCGGNLVAAGRVCMAQVQAWPVMLFLIVGEPGRR